MATKIWTGSALAVAQVDDITISLTWATSDTVAATINNKTITVTVGTASGTTDVAAALAAAINGDPLVGDETRNAVGSSIPEFAELTAVANGSVVTVTAKTADYPFIMTVVATTAGDGDAVIANVVAPTGPRNWADANNWSGGLPVSTDDVIIELSGTRIQYGLAQSSVDLTSLSIRGNVQIGMLKLNGNGYTEYRERNLKLGALTAGLIDTSSSLLRFDFGANSYAMNIFGSAGGRANDAAIQIQGTGTNSVQVYDGSVSFGQDGQVGALATLGVSGGSVVVGLNVNMSAATVTTGGGSLDLNANTLNLTVAGGSISVTGSSDITNLEVKRGSTLSYQGAGTITTANIHGALDLSTDVAPTTITNCTVYQSGAIRQIPEAVTFTNGIQLGTQVRNVNTS